MEEEDVKEGILSSSQKSNIEILKVNATAGTPHCYNREAGGGCAFLEELILLLVLPKNL